MRKRDFLQQLQRLRGALTAYCGHLLWSPADLEDVLQETMITGYRKRGDFAPGTDFKAWIFRIATLICFNFNRRSARETPPKPERTAPPQYGADEILKSPARVLENCRDEIAKACRELNDNERAILLLKAVGELTCMEIADVMDIPLGTAQGLLTRARSKVRERLSRNGVRA